MATQLAGRNGILGPSTPLYPGQAAADKARAIRYGDASEDYAVFNTMNKRYESAKTGNPWTGAIRGTNAFANAGAWTDKNPAGAGTGPSLPEFSTIKTIKQPEIATATGTLLGQQQKQSTATTNAFDSFLNEARDVNAQSKTQLVKDQAAFDTSKLEASLPKVNTDYRAEQSRITGDMASRNKDYASETAATIARLNDENNRYEAAARGVADKAIGAAQARTNLYQLTSGTPTSGSGRLSSRYLKNVSDVEVPLQRELSARRYGQITDFERPAQRELYGIDQALLSRESGLASDFAGRDENTMKYLNDLRMRVAGMERAQAQDYLNNLGIPLTMSQRIISGDIANVSGLQALDERANWYTAATPYDGSRVPSAITPSYTAPGRRYMGGGGDIIDVPSMVVPGAGSAPSPAVAGAGGESRYPSQVEYNTGYAPSPQTIAIWNRNRMATGALPYGQYGRGADAGRY